MTENLRLKLMGSPEVWLGDNQVRGFNSNKTRALLFYLAVSGKTHSRASLAGWFWGAMPEDKALTNLRKSLANLRKNLGEILELDRNTIRFSSPPHSLDIHELETQFTLAKQNSEISPLAITLYQGDFLEGFFLSEAPEFENWLYNKRAQLREDYLQTLRQLIQQDATRGEYATCIDYAKILLALEPWSETHHRLLMQLYAQNGQRSAALLQFESCKSILQKELGVGVTGATKDLYERIRAAETNPHNLPNEPYPLYGRTDEISTIYRMLLNPEQRLITVTGLGGAGKSRLALALAQRLSTHFIDGTWWIELASANTADDILSALASAIGYTFSGRSAARQEFKQFIKNKAVLFVMDNFEQLVESGAAFLAELLEAAPGLKFLVASRRALNLRQEWIFSLSGLPYPTAESTLTVAESHTPAAIQLFEATIQRRAHSFSLAQNFQAVQEICQLVAGNPLAIEMAAANIHQATLTEIATAIRTNIDNLQSIYQDISARHQSIRAVFEHSWALLDTKSQVAFVRLAIFRGSLRAEAATEIAGVAPAQLKELTDHSLLQKQGERYRLHELLAQFAIEKLSEESSSPELEQRHLAYYLKSLSQQASRLKTAQGRSARKELSLDAGNWQQAWASATTLQEWDALSVGVDGLVGYLKSMGRFDTLQVMLANCAALIQTSTDPTLDSLLSKILTYQADVTLVTGGAKDAILIAEKAWGLANQQNEPEGQIAAANQLIAARFQAGEKVAETRTLASEILTKARQTQRPDLLIELLLALGTELFFAGQADQARGYCEEALAVIQQHGLIGYLPLAELRLTMIHSSFGDLATSDDHLAKAQQAANQIDLSPIMQRSLSTAWGISHYRNDNHLQAEEFFEKSLSLSEELGDSFGQASSHANLANVLERKGDYGAAQTQMRKAIKIFRLVGGKAREARTQIDLGFRLMATHDYAAGLEALQNSIHLLESIGATGSIAGAYWRAGLLLARVGQFPRAAEQLQAADRYLQKAYSTENACGVALSNAWLAYFQGDYSKGLQQNLEAIALARKSEPSWLADTLTCCGYLKVATEEWPAATRAFAEAQVLLSSTNQEHFETETRIGLAWVAQVRGDFKEALIQLEGLPAYLARKYQPNSFNGTWHPYDCFLTLYQVLAKNEHPRAAAILEKAGAHLGETLEKLPADWQHDFIHQIASHQTLSELTAQSINFSTKFQ